MKVSELIKVLNKIKKKYPDAQVFSVSGSNDEMTFLDLKGASVAYTDIPLESIRDSVAKGFYSFENFVKEYDCDPNVHVNHIPIIILRDE